MTKKKAMICTIMAVSFCLTACGSKNEKKETTITDGETAKSAVAEQVTNSEDTINSSKIVSQTGEKPSTYEEAAANWKNAVIEEYIKGYPYPYFQVKYEERAMDYDLDGEMEYEVCINLWGDMTTWYEDYVILDQTKQGIVAVADENYYFFNGYKLNNGQYANEENYSDGYTVYIYNYEGKDGFVEECYLDYYEENGQTAYEFGNIKTGETKALTEEQFNDKLAELITNVGCEEYEAYEIISSLEYQYDIEK